MSEPIEAFTPAGGIRSPGGEEPGEDHPVPEARTGESEES